MKKINENELSMKKFYDTISPIQKKFLDKEIKGKNILDVGAATGKLTEYLSGKGFHVYSLDINERLINKAAQKGISVVNMNMLDIDKLEKFDTIINIGNTIPHLNNNEEIYEFLEKSYHQLNNGGKIIIQIINFSKFVKKKDENNFLGTLPLIENENVKFERFYYLNEEGNIIFKTILDDNIENEEILLNINYNELKGYFEKIGFKNIKTYGGFDKSVFDIDKSTPLVMTGEK